MAVVHYLIDLIRWHRLELFWPIWCTLTAAAIICTAWMLRLWPVQGLYKPEQYKPEESHRPQFRLDRTSIICIVMLGVFLGAYSAMILVGEDFAMYDNSQFTSFSLRGVNFPVQIWPQGGRFFPLGLQEFNLIGHFTRTIYGYHALPIAELVILALIFLSLDEQVSIATRVLLAIATLITPSVVVSFTGLIYPERNILLLLLCLALFIKRFEQTRFAPWAIAMVLCAQILLYLKEPVFLLLLGFSSARILMRIRTADRAWSVAHLWNYENRLDLCLAALAMAYIAFFASMTLPYTGAQYLADRHVSLIEAVRYYVHTDLLAWIFAIVFTVRSLGIMRRVIVPDLLWDGLACGGVAYFASYVGLRMVSSYYLAPVDLIAVAYVGHLISSSWGEWPFRVRALAAVLGVCVVLQSLELSAFRVLERKYFIQQKSAMARVILEAYRREPGSVLKVSFPLTEPYMLSEFASYLSYRGGPVEEEVGDRLLPGAGIRILGARIAKDGRCVTWRTFVCHPESADASGVVIVLPDDVVLSPEDATLRQRILDRLHSSDPRTLPLRWLIAVLRFHWAHGPR